MSACPHCQKKGRFWPVAANDAFCGLCGRALHEIQVRLGGLDVPKLVPGQSPDRRVWLVGTGQDKVKVEIRNTGELPTEITASVEPSQTASISLPRSVIEPHGVCEAILRLTPPPGQAEFSFRLEVGAGGAPAEPAGASSGPALMHVAIVEVRPAPAVLFARALPEDEWIDLALKLAESKGDYQSPGTSGPGWHLSQRVLMPWMSAGCVSMLLNFPASPQSTGAFDGIGVTHEWKSPVDAVVQVSACQVKPGAIQLEFRVPPQPTSNPIQGELTLNLETVGRPRVVIPIEIRPGRPEWLLREPSSSQCVLVPEQYPSIVCVKYSKFEAVADEHLLTEVIGYRLDVRCTEPGVRVRVQRRSRQVPQGLPDLIQSPAFAVRVQPERPGEFFLDVALLVRLKNFPQVETPLARPQRLRVKAVARGDPTMAAERDLIVDFGTSNTVIVDGSDPSGEASACMDLPDLRREGDPKSIIQTVLWVRGTDTPDDPECLVGTLALEQEEAKEGQLFRHFKTDVGKEDGAKPYCLVPRDGGAPWPCEAADLMRFFLRELVLEARRNLNNRPIKSLLMTYPPAFSETQRRAINKVLTNLKECGIAGDVRAVLDEANAGAFEDLLWNLLVKPEKPNVLYAIIFDFGGGTIDIAVVCATRRASDVPGTGIIYDVVPKGVSGLTFAGKKITDAIARILERKLLAALIGPGNMKFEGKDWIPLRSINHPLTDAKIRHLAEENRQALFEIAERIKTLWYGSFGASSAAGEPIEIPQDQDWYANLNKEITGTQILGLLKRPPSIRLQLKKINGGDEDLAGNKAVIDDLKLTRQEIDEAIKPALREAFGRARRLWERVRQGADPAAGSSQRYRPPDLVLLAGGSSQLPLIWKTAEEKGDEGLGVQASQIAYNRATAKIKVALGAMRYYLRSTTTAELQLSVQDPTQYVLVPIVRRVPGNRAASRPGSKSRARKIPDEYHELFPLGWAIFGQETDKPVEHLYGPQFPQFKIRLCERIDYRDIEWDVPADLADLLGREDDDGLWEGEPPRKTDTQKERELQREFKLPLEDFEVELASIEDSTIQHWIRRVGDRRVISIKYRAPGGGFKTQEQEI